MAGTGLGSTLRHAREQQGLSLDDIARRTNIPSHLLKAIERSALNEVPGGLFTRSYLRAYARALGLDGENVVNEYLSESSEDSSTDILDQLRARFHVGDRQKKDIVQLVLVIAGVTCLLYILILLRDSSPAGDAHHDQQWLHPSGVSSLLSPVGGRLASLDELVPAKTA